MSYRLELTVGLYAVSGATDNDGNLIRRRIGHQDIQLSAGTIAEAEGQLAEAVEQTVREGAWIAIGEETGE